MRLAMGRGRTLAFCEVALSGDPDVRDSPERNAQMIAGVAAFTFAHDGPRIDSPPPRLGQHNDEILAELGYSRTEIAELRARRVI